MSNAGSLLIDGPNVAGGAGSIYSAMACFGAGDWYVAQARNEGWYVCSGCQITANASTITGISTTVASSLLNKTAHGLVVGDSVTLTGLTGATTGISNATLYYVVATGFTVNAFRVATTQGGAALPFGGSNESTVITATQVGKLDMSAGTIFAGTTECNVSAVTAFGTTITTLAAGLSAGQAVWVACEADPTSPSTPLNLNAGVAAAVSTNVNAPGGPVKPTPTSNRVVVAWLYIPATATAVDNLILSATGTKAKIMEARQLVTVHPGRRFATDVAQTSIPNPTTLTSILSGATAIPIPAGSLNVGDIFKLTASGTYKNTQNNATVGIQVPIGASVNVLTYTTALLNLDATNGRRWTLDLTLVVSAIGNGTSGLFTKKAEFKIGPPSAFADAGPFLTGGGANGEIFIGGGTSSSGFDSTVAQSIDLKFVVGTSSSTSFFLLREFDIFKLPV